MWDLGSRWLDVSAVVLVVALVIVEAAGRAWAYGLMAPFGLAAAWMHLVWLPRHGIDGWTGEPRAKYLELMRSRARR